MTELKYNDSFPNTIKEMLKHEEKCNNETCKVNGWDKLKVIEVEYIGFTVDEENTNEGSVASYESYDPSANDQNGDNDNSPLGPDSSIENSENPTSSPRPESCTEHSSDNNSSRHARSFCCVS